MRNTSFPNSTPIFEAKQNQSTERNDTLTEIVVRRLHEEIKEAVHKKNLRPNSPTSLTEQNHQVTLPCNNEQEQSSVRPVPNNSEIYNEQHVAVDETSNFSEVGNSLVQKSANIRNKFEVATEQFDQFNSLSAETNNANSPQHYPWKRQISAMQSLPRDMPKQSIFDSNNTGISDKFNSSSTETKNANITQNSPCRSGVNRMQSLPRVLPEQSTFDPVNTDKLDQFSSSCAETNISNRSKISPCRSEINTMKSLPGVLPKQSISGPINTEKLDQFSSPSVDTNNTNNRQNPPPRSEINTMESLPRVLPNQSIFDLINTELLDQFSSPCVDTNNTNNRPNSPPRSEINLVQSLPQVLPKQSIFDPINTEELDQFSSASANTNITNNRENSPPRSEINVMQCLPQALPKQSIFDPINTEKLDQFSSHSADTNNINNRENPSPRSEINIMQSLDRVVAKHLISYPTNTEKFDQISGFSAGTNNANVSPNSTFRKQINTSIFDPNSTDKFAKCSTHDVGKRSSGSLKNSPFKQQINPVQDPSLVLPIQSAIDSMNTEKLYICPFGDTSSASGIKNSPFKKQINKVQDPPPVSPKQSSTPVNTDKYYICHFGDTSSASGIKNPPFKKQINKVQKPPPILPKQSSNPINTEKFGQFISPSAGPSGTQKSPVKKKITMKLDLNQAMGKKSMFDPTDANIIDLVNCSSVGASSASGMHNNLLSKKQMKTKQVSPVVLPRQSDFNPAERFDQFDKGAAGISSAGGITQNSPLKNQNNLMQGNFQLVFQQKSVSNSLTDTNMIGQINCSSAGARSASGMHNNLLSKKQMNTKQDSPGVLPKQPVFNPVERFDQFGKGAAGISNAGGSTQNSPLKNPNNIIQGNIQQVSQQKSVSNSLRANSQAILATLGSSGIKKSQKFANKSHCTKCTERLSKSKEYHVCKFRLRWKCHFCAFVADKRQTITFHRREHHTSQRYRSKANKKPNKHVPEGRILECNTCSKRYATLPSMKRHISHSCIQHYPNEPTTVNQHPRLYVNPQDLKYPKNLKTPNLKKPNNTKKGHTVQKSRPEKSTEKPPCFITNDGMEYAQHLLNVHREKFLKLSGTTRLITNQSSSSV